MRSVAVLLLVLSTLAALRASTDRVHSVPTVRSTPRRFLLLSIARPQTPAPPSPSRRDYQLESALDEEEETNDLEPLRATEGAGSPAPPASSRPEPSAIPTSRGPSPALLRNSPLRC